MARTFTAAELETLIRERSDTVGNNFVTSSEIIRLIDKAYTKLYDMIVSKFENYYLSQTQFSSTSGVQDYTLPADFYKLLGVDQTNAPGKPLTLRPLNFNERNRYNTDLFSVTQMSTYKYRVAGNLITIIPQPSAGILYTLFYVPAPIKIANNTDVIDGIAGWEDYVILDASVQILNKMQLDSNAVAQERALAERRVMHMATERDAGFPEKVTDVSTLTDNSGMFPW